MKYSASLVLYSVRTSLLILDKYRLYRAYTRRLEVLNTHFPYKFYIRYIFLPKRSLALPI